MSRDSMVDYERWAAEDAAAEAEEAALAAKTLKAAEEWRAQWPEACTACHGYGGHTVRNYPHAPDDFEPCEALPIRTCHRCAAPKGLKRNGGGPCRVCGWDYDDGEPSP